LFRRSTPTAPVSHHDMTFFECMVNRVVCDTEAQRELVDGEPALIELGDLVLVFFAQFRLVARSNRNTVSTQMILDRLGVDPVASAEARQRLALLI
jgi:microcystin degradation protein MlrC